MSRDVRRNPCATCPYRCDVPSGVWAPEEYERLRRYDGSIMDQAVAGATAAFACHQADGKLCAGWVGHRDEPGDLLAIRLEVSSGKLDPSVRNYETKVPLFRSGAEAADHGMAEIDAPGERATAIIDKLLRIPGVEVRR